MIVYDLVCPEHHRFEGWFSSRKDFISQKDNGLLVCPVCGAEGVDKLPSASRLNLRHSRQVEHSGSSSNETQSGSDNRQDSQALMEKLREYVNNTYENVGEKFAEEAKKIHYGESEKRNIRGEATLEEVGNLLEEGIEAVPLPAGISDKKKKLN